MKAHLRQRVADIATGAAGFEFDCDAEFATAEFLQRFIPALQVMFEVKPKKDADGHFVTPGNEYLFRAHNFANYNDVQSTTDFLFEHGVRP